MTASAVSRGEEQYIPIAWVDAAFFSDYEL